MLGSCNHASIGCPCYLESQFHTGHPCAWLISKQLYRVRIKIQSVSKKSYLPRTHRWASASSFFPSRCSPVFLSFSLAHWCTTSSSSSSSRWTRFRSRHSLHTQKQLHFTSYTPRPSYLRASVFSCRWPRRCWTRSSRLCRSCCACPVRCLPLRHLLLPARELTALTTSFSRLRRSARKKCEWVMRCSIKIYGA